VATYTFAELSGGLVYDGSHIWVGTNTSATEIDASDGTVLGSFAVLPSTISMTFDGTNIWVSGGEGVTKLRAADGKSLATISSTQSNEWIAFDGANIWTADFETGVVSKY
jgi:hypothetical protein